MIAVLAGDIIKSSRLTPEELQSVKDCISETCDELQQKFRFYRLSSPFFFRGDGWQLVVEDPCFSLHVAVFIYAALRRQNIAQTRIVIAVDDVDVLDRTNLDRSSGPAFVEAGNFLDGMNSRSSDLVYALSSKDRGPRNGLAYWGIASCVGAIMSNWTSRQAEIAYSVLLSGKEKTYAEMAGRLEQPISQQAFSESLQSAKFSSLDNGMIAYQVVMHENLQI